MTSKQRSLLKVVHKNVNILLRLVNQILDFRKYENGVGHDPPLGWGPQLAPEGCQREAQA